MRLLKDSFKLTPPKDVASDAKREGMLRLDSRLELLASVAFILAGCLVLIDKNLFNFPPPTEDILIGIGMVCFLFLVIASFRVAGFNLKPKDEYEQDINRQVYSQGYELLRWSLIFLFIFHEIVMTISLAGVLLLILGITSFITAWKRYANARESTEN